MKLPSNQSAQATLPLGSRATEPPKPFIKWAGGKRQLVPELLRCVPEKYGTYFEPFLGGAALFFALRPQRAVLSDLNDRLIRAYRGVANDVERVISELSRWPHDREFFLNVRSTDTSRMSDADVAAWFIYLNRTAFNGLYRVNRDNQFNVPFGDYKNPTICDREVLRLASAALAACEVIQAVDFEDAVKAAREGDFVYLDPPYVPVSEHSNFARYTSDVFGLDDHRRLRDVALSLKRRGVKVLLSNSNAPAVRELYASEFQIRAVSARRAVSCKGDGRGAIEEVIIR